MLNRPTKRPCQFTELAVITLFFQQKILVSNLLSHEFSCFCGHVISGDDEQPQEDLKSHTMQHFVVVQFLHHKNICSTWNCHHVSTTSFDQYNHKLNHADSQCRAFYHMCVSILLQIILQVHQFLLYILGLQTHIDCIPQQQIYSGFKSL